MKSPIRPIVTNVLTIVMVSSQSMRLDRRLNIELMSRSLRASFCMVGNLYKERSRDTGAAACDIMCCKSVLALT